MLLATSTASACATTQTLSADVDFSFRDQNGMGWVTLDGVVSVTFTFADEDGSLTLSGKRHHADLLLTGVAPDMEVTEAEYHVYETLPLHDVRRTRKTITFELDPGHDHLTGSCAPTTIEGLDRTTHYECTIAGFEWHSIATLPELHHPIVLDADTRAKTRIVNTMTGSTTPGFGQRVVREE